MIKITVLVDNLNGTRSNFVKSYGFAALIEMEKKCILFDTGSTAQSLVQNLSLMGYTPKDLECLILSHNHDDHTDGLQGILQKNPSVLVYVHKDWEKMVSFMGFQVPLKNRNMRSQSGELTEISSNIILTKSHYSSDYGGIYEHACYLRNIQEGSYILLCGCCHPGLTTFLREREQLGIPITSPLYIIGGMHGFRFSNSEAECLKPIIKKIILCHCTSHLTAYKRQFEEKVSVGIVGETYTF
ncbi:MAG: putative 7, 8-dihydropterin-6-yl-methyl-4-(Beta-D-ribofuranosyl)aminobenzene 5'-phosphate synthase [Promethearchaeota archaeon]|nr:MAG: putative 7, 8-dihydropterin-6-yl-methyl-4-(Beta-D-ribofuranosyl)aminobenzene 5'-phosphate synthase [Candidatus Lokiarchaeota archaeon]